MRYLTFLLLAALLPFNTFAQSRDNDETALHKLFRATMMINKFYVDTVDINRQVEDAIVGMLSRLDPHSTYTNAEETQRLNEPLQGNFDGIGVQFNMLDDTLLVIQPTSKGPSERAGILAGDRIVTVNDTAIAGVNMSRENIMKRLRGPRGTMVKLGIARRGIEGLLTFNIKRDQIPVNTLDAAYMIEPGIGLIRFSSFGATTHNEVTDAIRRLQEEGMTDLILDLQGNGGGYLGMAAKIASEFLPNGDLIVYTKTRGDVYGDDFRSQGSGLMRKGRLVVMVDEYTASAAEIVAGAIQDHDRGIIVGRRTYGKGLVQRPIELDDGSMIRLTIARYYTPSGRCIQKPYEKGDSKTYGRDVIERYNRGELTNADSIHFPDSLRYTTLVKGRTVYGGGGIMPDRFVPLDTTRYTKLYRELSAHSYIINSSLHYMDQHRKQLKNTYSTFMQFKAEFQIPQTVINDMLAEAKQKDKLEAKDDEELQKTILLVSRTLKALVARDIWDMDEYFNIIYEDDPVVQQALEILHTNYNI
ncbi:MAG: S41 family peptidase [Bacteroidaceae bacterium]|nr:S41 family peptidase [Bacteroidaceae bacterium]